MFVLTSAHDASEENFLSLHEIIFKRLIRQKIFGEVRHEEDEMRDAEQDERHAFGVDICAENFFVNAGLNYVARNFLEALNFGVNHGEKFAGIIYLAEQKFYRVRRTFVSRADSRKNFLQLFYGRRFFLINRVGETVSVFEVLAQNLYVDKNFLGEI